MNRWLGFLLPRNWGRLSRALIGDVNYKPPLWAIASFRGIVDSMRKKPGVWASVIVLTGFSLISGHYYNQWWEAHKPRPKPLVEYRDIKGSLAGAQDFKAPIRINFSGSTAELDAVGKPLSSGVTITPPQAGQWRWTSDRVLSFEPAKVWPAATEYEVKLDKAILPKLVRIETTAWKFKTAAISPRIVKTEFYTDLKDPSLHQIVAELRFNLPVAKAELEKHIGIEVLTNAPLFAWQGKAPASLFTITEDTAEDLDEQQKHRHFWLRTARIALPEQEELVRLSITKGLASMHGGAVLEENVSGKERVPDIYSGFSIADARTEIIRTDEGEPEQFLFVDTSGYATPEELDKHLEVWLLPKDRPAETTIVGKTVNKIAFEKDHHWEGTGEVTDKVLSLSKRISLKRTEMESDEKDSAQQLTKVHALKFLIEQEGQLFVRVTKGVASLGGFKLKRDALYLKPVPVFPKEVELLGKGGVLAINGERKVSIKTRGVEHLRITLSRVPYGQVNHLACFSDGQFQSPYFSNYQINEENITHIKREVRDIPIKNEYQANYTSFDFTDALAKPDPADPDASRGMYFVEFEAVKPRFDKDTQADDPDVIATKKRLEGMDPAIAGWVRVDGNDADEEDGRYRRRRRSDDDSRGASDKRFVLITDLGLLMKKNADGTREMFVQSISKGEPVDGAKVTVLAKNGEFITEATTSEGGHAHLIKVDHLRKEKTPVAITVRFGNDVAFIPFDRPQRQLDFSRFDTVGVLASAKTELDGSLFTERGVYRPGDTVHLSGIVRQRDWQGKLDGLPMEIIVTDAKDEEHLRKKFALPADGFFDLEIPTDEGDPTGRYAVNLHVLHADSDDHGSRVAFMRFRVEDFQPDRMKLDLAFNKPTTSGWVLPADVKATLTLKTLFDFPAADRRLTAKLELNPAEFAFEQYADFSFHNRLRDESKSRAGETVELGEQKTNAQGQAEFNLGLERFKGGCFQAMMMAEGFEADGGRSVRTGKELLVSPLPYVVGLKADGDLGYIGKDSQRNVQFIAIGPDLKKIALPELTQRLVQIKYLSVLTKQENGSYAYVSTRREKKLKETPFALKAEGETYAVPTSEAGDFRVELRDKDDNVLLLCSFTIVGKGDSQRSLERNAELEVKLAKDKWNSGEQLEFSMSAPYTGAGLITIEREKVLTWQWFKSTTTSSTQHIPVPADIEGTAYVNVSFVRGLDSPEVFMSPLSYAVAPFTANPDRRKFAVEIDAPKIVKPGTTMSIGYKAAKPCRIAVYAVDAGIHQITDYKLPDPLTDFFKKRALEVESEQLLDLLLPEFSLLMKSKAFGGDEDALKKHLNPFKRRKEPPVVFWSGLIEAGPDRHEITYDVPDYFAGKLNIMAVAVAADGIGTGQTSSIVRGPMVLTPNVPVFAAPGDEFTASLTVANNLEGSNPSSDLTIEATGSEHLEITDGASKAASIAPGKEGTVRFKFHVKDQLGGAEITFKASGGGESMLRHATLSVRPAAPYLTNVQSGYFRLKQQDVKVQRVMYPQFRKLEATSSALPLGLCRGLEAYLRDYPHGCSEQITSRAMSRLLLANEVDFGFDKSEAVQAIDDAFAMLRTRQHSNGGFGYWDSYCNDAVDYLSVYVTQFLTEARDGSYAVPEGLLEGARNRMKQIAKANTQNLHDAGIQAAAIYLLTRNGEVTTNYLLNLRDTLEKRFKDQWQSTLAAPYMASTYVLLKQEKEGRALMDFHRKGAPMKPWFDPWRGWYYEDPQVRNAQVFTLTCRHFPEIARKFGYDDIGVITEPLARNRFNTISSAWSILALKAYSELASKVDVKLAISEIPRIQGEAKLIIPESGGMLNAPFSKDAGTIRFQLNQGGKADLGAFYQVTETGFETGVPTDKIADGIEVFRELVDQDTKDAKPLDKLKVGQGVTVRIRVRNVSPDALNNLALLDLMPGGFEIEANSLRPGKETPGADHVDVREDRNVFFCALGKGEVKTFVYRIKPVTAGTFVIPPVFAESMYDRGIKGRAGGSKMVVESAE